MEASWMKMTNIKDQSKMSTMKKYTKCTREKRAYVPKQKEKLSCLSNVLYHHDRK